MKVGDRFTKTCRRWDIPFQTHELTFSCYQNKSLLKSQRTCDWLIESIEKARQKHIFSLWAYVVMPNHVHLLIYPETKNYSISSILQSIKQPVSRKAIKWLRDTQPEFLNQLATGQKDRPYHFWQKGGGYDRNITNFHTLCQTLRYFHLNPIRKGLAKLPKDWYYSSAAVWANICNEPLAIDRDTWPF